MSVKTFTAARASKRGVKAEFNIDWEDDDAQSHTETFYCWPAQAPGGVVFDLHGISNSSVPMWEFYRAVFTPPGTDPEEIPAEYMRFRAFVRAAGHGVEADTLREITSWIIEYDTGTPTLPSSS